MSKKNYSANKCIQVYCFVIGLFIFAIAFGVTGGLHIRDINTKLETLNKIQISMEQSQKNEHGRDTSTN